MNITTVKNSPQYMRSEDGVLDYKLDFLKSMRFCDKCKRYTNRHDLELVNGRLICTRCIAHSGRLLIASEIGVKYDRKNTTENM